MSTPDISRPIDACRFVVFGEPASKANSRQMVKIKGVTRFIKSKKALNYVAAFALQCPKLDPVMEGDLSATITIFYASRRPDLDEAVILDCMQGGIYKNDRQVKEKHIYWALDRENPRAEIEISPICDKGCH